MVSYIPEDLAEALAMRRDYDVTPYGGGTDLMVEGRENTGYLFLHKVRELREIKEDQEYVRIGSGCAFTEIQNHPLTPPLLKKAVSEIAAPAIRNLGTIGGNVANGSPKADSALALCALGAVIRLAGTHGERLVPFREFYLGRRMVDLGKDELIVEFLVPHSHVGPFYHEKIGARKALAISRVSFAGVMTERNGRITYCSTAFGAINDVIVTRPELDARFVGKTVREAGKLREAYLQEYRDALAPQKGRISAEYRKRVCVNMLSAFLDAMGAVCE